MLNQIKGFLETSFLDWPGKIVSVVFFPTCNFRCPYCHNHSLVLNPEQYETISVEYILGCLSEFKNWVDGICITGGEPTLHASLFDIICKFKSHDFLIKLDTNGTNPAVLKDLIENRLVDYVSMDVKGPLDEIRYSRCSGVKVELNDIKESIKTLKEGTIPYEFRVTVVPTLITEDDIIDLAKQLSRADKFTLSNFNPSNPLDIHLKDVTPYDEEILKKLQHRVDEIVKMPTD
ncbi:MAG: anaerobic ribonucleoside-triphosphate reductase activating protein [Thermodesulfobacteriota bacterium]|nr:anaerobic ribonucleoside-triphosphate reductase activating protein [Thermodesulfobacteriota bacterium]